MNFTERDAAVAHARYEAWVHGDETVVIQRQDGQWDAGLPKDVFTFSEHMPTHVGDSETFQPSAVEPR